MTTVQRRPSTSSDTIVAWRHSDGEILRNDEGPYRRYFSIYRNHVYVCHDIDGHAWVIDGAYVGVPTKVSYTAFVQAPHTDMFPSTRFDSVDAAILALHMGYTPT